MAESTLLPTYYTHPMWGKCSIYRHYEMYVTIKLHSEDSLLKDQIKSCLENELTEIPSNVIEIEQQLQQVRQQQQTPTVKKVDINNLSATEIIRLVPGLGRMQVKHIKDAMPKPLGYEHFQQFREFNKDIFDQEEAWQSLEAKLDFVPLKRETGT